MDEKKVTKKPERVEKIARKDHDKTGLVRVVWDYVGNPTSKRSGKKYESWVKPAIAEIYKKKMASTNKKAEPVREPIEVK
jgi:hypothetical protein